MFLTQSHHMTWNLVYKSDGRYFHGDFMVFWRLTDMSCIKKPALSHGMSPKRCVHKAKMAIFRSNAVHFTH